MSDWKRNRMKRARFKINGEKPEFIITQVDAEKIVVSSWEKFIKEPENQKPKTEEDGRNIVLRFVETMTENALPKNIVGDFESKKYDNVMCYSFHGDHWRDQLKNKLMEIFQAKNR